MLRRARPVPGSALSVRALCKARAPAASLAASALGAAVLRAARGALLVVVLVGLVSLAPVQQDQWWQQSTLLPHFLMVADWSKNLILNLTSQWLASGITDTPELPFKDVLSQPVLPERP